MLKKLDCHYYSFAGCIIKIALKPCEFPFLKSEMELMLSRHYKGFEIGGGAANPDYSIQISHQLMTEYLLKKGNYYVKIFGRQSQNTYNVHYGISTFQFNQLLRTLIQEYLETHDGFIVHASSVAHNGHAYLFTGNPGAGKSTIMKLLQKSYTPLTDDSVILKKEGDLYILYQTPAQEKEDWIERKNKGYILKGVFFLKKAQTFRIDSKKNKSITQKKLLSQFWFQSVQSSIKQIKTFFSFVQSFDEFYEVSFAKDAKKITELFTKWEHV